MVPLTDRQALLLFKKGKRDEGVSTSYRFILSIRRFYRLIVIYVLFSTSYHHLGPVDAKKNDNQNESLI